MFAPDGRHLLLTQGEDVVVAAVSNGAATVEPLLRGALSAFFDGPLGWPTRRV